MMKIFRTNTKIILWTVIAAFLGTIFVVWGMKGENAWRSPQALAVVNGEEISYFDVEPILKRQLDQYREMYKDNFTDEIAQKIKEMVVQQIVMQRLLLQTAKKMSIDVTIVEIAKKIKKYPVFLNKDGSFNEEKYKTTIRNIPPQQWDEIEKEEKNSLIIEKLVSLIFDSAKVTDEEVKDDYILNSEIIKAKYILVDFSQFKDKESTKKKAEEIKNKLNIGAKFETVAGENNGLKETEEFTRKQPNLVNLGNASNFIKTAFSMKLDGTVSEPVEVEKGYAILKLSTRKGIDEEKFNKEKDTIKTTLKRTKGYTLYNEWLQELRNKNNTNIKIYSDNVKNI